MVASTQRRENIEEIMYAIIIPIIKCTVTSTLSSFFVICGDHELPYFCYNIRGFLSPFIHNLPSEKSMPEIGSKHDTPTNVFYCFFNYY